jgi:hypothetical protein
VGRFLSRFSMSPTDAGCKTQDHTALLAHPVSLPVSRAAPFRWTITATITVDDSTAHSLSVIVVIVHPLPVPPCILHRPESVVDDEKRKITGFTHNFRERSVQDFINTVMYDEGILDARWPRGWPLLV